MPVVGLSVGVVSGLGFGGLVGMGTYVFMLHQHTFLIFSNLKQVSDAKWSHYILTGILFSRRARRSAYTNGCHGRCDIRHGDIRDIAEGRRFDIVTGTPPYFELYGWVEDALAGVDKVGSPLILF